MPSSPPSPEPKILSSGSLVGRPNLDAEGEARLAALASLFSITDQASGRRVPLVLTTTQRKIFLAIVRRDYPRYHVITSTRYGKSLTVALGVLIRAACFPEKWAIVAPTMPKAMIIMRYLIEHAFDSPVIRTQLDVADSLERLRKERSKTRLTFKGGGEVFVLSADASSPGRGGLSLMGFGSCNIVCLPYQSKVITNRGPMAIGDVVRQRLPCAVLAYDHATDAQVFRTVTNYFTSGESALVEVDYGHGKLRCTANHPVYVPGRGYVPAGELQPGDQVWVAEFELVQPHLAMHTMPREDPGKTNVLAVETVRSVCPVDGPAVPTYNLGVAGDGNYFADNVLVHNCDESAELPDAIYAKVKRMLGDQTDNFLMEIGNPWFRNHFLKSSVDPAYRTIVADWRVAVDEGRLSMAFVEEMRAQADFGVLYDCRFPAADAVDDGGWAPLLSQDDIDRARLKEGEATPPHAGERRLGVDVARAGANRTVQVLRSLAYAEIVGRGHTPNLMEVAARTAHLAKEKAVDAANVFIDDVGVGGGVTDMLRSGHNLPVRAVNAGAKATDAARFGNVRAEAYWRLAQWVKKGGRLSRDAEWDQLAALRYRLGARGAIMIMGKEEMRSRGVESPDVADSLALTFARPEVHRAAREAREGRLAKRLKRFIGRGLKVSMGGY